MEAVPEINEFDFGEGYRALVVELPIPPFGTVPIATEDTSDDSRHILDTLISGWPGLWPEMLARLQEDMKGYGCEQDLGKDEFQGSISRMDPDCYMGDQSDYYLSLQFDEPPMWDFFLKGTQIVHFQPVF